MTGHVPPFGQLPPVPVTPLYIQMVELSKAKTGTCLCLEVFESAGLRPGNGWPHFGFFVLHVANGGRLSFPGSIGGLWTMQ
jgi:hypothetical protein